LATPNFLESAIPWQRVEIFNTFRQAERAGLIASGESRYHAVLWRLRLEK
jgi:hypothetical protein